MTSQHIPYDLMCMGGFFMKKFIFVMLIILNIPTTNISAEDNIVQDMQKRSNVAVIKDNYVYYYSPGDKIGTVFQHITVNNTYSYCLKFTDVIENTNDHKLDDPYTLFSKEQWEIFSLYAMYGERLFSETNDVKYRYATQALIHEQTNVNKTPMQFYEISPGKKDIFSVERYKQEILSLYNIHITLPKLDISNTEFKVGNEYEFIDENNVISKYNIETTSEFADFFVEDNKLKISVKSAGVQNFSLVSSKYSQEGDVLLWTSTKYQDLVSVSAFNPSRTDYTFQTNNKVGSVVISKRDTTTKELLTGAVFNLKKVDGLEEIDLGNYNVDKELKIDDLELGKYILEEISAPKGYTKTLEKNSFEIIEDNQVVKIAIDNMKSLPSTGLKTPQKAVFLLSLVVFLITVKKSLLK